MRTTGLNLLLNSMIVIAIAGHCILEARAQAEQARPTASILWPHPGDSFSTGTILRIKADAQGSEATITQVQFFADVNLIGTVTNSPFNLTWQLDENGASYGNWNLRAVATDTAGSSGESATVKVSYYTGGPPGPVVQITSPSHRAFFAAPAMFVFSAEVLASLGDTGPVEFFVGTNSVGLSDSGTYLTATTPPSFVTVTNLPEGEHRLTVRYRGLNGFYCLSCLQNTNTIHVVKLGARSPSRTPDGRLQFAVVTSFPGQDNLIQVSSNLVQWTTISTNRPNTNTFTFSETSPATNRQQFYRAFVPPP